MEVRDPGAMGVGVGCLGDRESEMDYSVGSEGWRRVIETGALGKDGACLRNPKESDVS